MQYLLTPEEYEALKRNSPGEQALREIREAYAQEILKSPMEEHFGGPVIRVLQLKAAFARADDAARKILQDQQQTKK